MPPSGRFSSEPLILIEDEFVRSRMKKNFAADWSDTSPG